MEGAAVSWLVWVGAWALAAGLVGWLFSVVLRRRPSDAEVERAEEVRRQLAGRRPW